jgi:hypothetical protein
MNPTDIRIGAHLVDYQTAHRWVMEYFNADVNFTAKRPFAYPAYDKLQTGSVPDKLNDGDLLAPAMLNAAVGVAGLYSLQRIRPQLEEALHNTPEVVSDPISASPTTTPRSQRRSAGASTACLSRSSWRLRGCASCR